MNGATGVGLPQPLAPSEAAQVRRIFTLQGAGSMAEAARETDQLPTDLLLGAILADRYLRTQPTTAELTTWLARYGDQAEAPAIRGLLDRMAPAAAASSEADDPAPPRRGAARSAASLRSLFVGNRDAEAAAVAGARQVDPEALLIGGLATLRLGRGNAAALFEAAWREASSAAVRAAGAFWAARVAQREGDRGKYAVWMRRAAQDDDTFYGAIARRALGPPVACVSADTIGNADLEALLAAPQGRRAFALLQVGEKRLAEAELRAFWLDAARDGTFDRPVALVARAVGFIQLQSEVEQNVVRRSYGGGLVRLQPASGFLIDPPLVYALVRHESNFHAGAVSNSGARGLMQIMPSTAYAVAGGQASRLQEPAVNLAIGQKLVLTLAEDDAIDGDLIRLLAGYGQGQGGLRKWVDAVRDDGDPLMFIEAIPNPGTRAYIRDALMSSWHYAAELHLPASSLDALAAGRYPRLVRAGEDPRRVNGACPR
jgi:soluble lytic murein transglycosylase-like protein